MKMYTIFLINRPDIAHQRAASQDTTITIRGHIQVAHTLSYQPLHCQISKEKHVAGYI